MLDSLKQNSDEKLSDVVKCQNKVESERNLDILTLSKIRQLLIRLCCNIFVPNKVAFDIFQLGSYHVGENITIFEFSPDSE